MATRMQLKAQSAMEYLMTYGWAILIISVVLASLFSLGVFNAGASLSTACVPLAGYMCSNPVLHSGNLILALGQSTGITWYNALIFYDPTGITGCDFGLSSNNYLYMGPIPSVPSGTVSQSAEFPQGAGTVFPPSAAPGTSYSGTIWVGYNTAGASNLCSQLATISLKAT